MTRVTFAALPGVGYVDGMAMDCLVLLSDPKLQCVLSGLLGGLDIAVHLAVDPDEALGAMMQTKFDAVIVDCCEFANGAAIIRSMRQLAPNGKTIAFAILPADMPQHLRTEIQAHFVIQQPLSVDLMTRSLRAARDMMLQERRRYFRYAIELRVTLETMHAGAMYEELQVRTTNLSAGGMAVVVNAHLKPSWFGKIQFSLPEGGGRIEARGEIAWLLAGKTAGLRFTQISDKHRTAIEQWISSRVVEDDMAANRS